MPEFDGKVAFITGGAAGFGLAFARALGERGAAVVAADIDGDATRQAVDELRRDGIEALGVACDVADEVAVRRAVDQATSAFGGIDILINNAALHLRRYNQPFAELTSEEIRSLFDVNVIGIVNCSVACAESMRTREGGAIVNMASAAGFSARSPYGVTKLAVRGLTICLAHELGADGVRVNAIAPGMTPTASVLAEYGEGDFDYAVNVRQLLRRRGAVEDITRTMLFLCSEDSAFVTGETIRVTGGADVAI